MPLNSNAALRLKYRCKHQNMIVGILDFPPYRLHDCRYFFASYCHAEGVNEANIQKTL